MNSDETVFYSTSQKGSDNSLIPMINIVFLLLIFFMVAGHISYQSDPNIELPKAAVKQKLSDTITRIEFNSSHQIKINGDTVALKDLSTVIDGMSTKGNIALVVDKHITAIKLDPILEVLRSLNQASVTLLVQSEVSPE